MPDAPLPAQSHAHDHAGHDHAGHDHGRQGHAGHHHHHDHGGLGHAHHHAAHATVQGLRWALIITAAFLVVETIGGFISNSLALLADAGHMLTDVAALALSLFVAWFARQPASPEKSYGYLRWEVLAAFLNGGTLLLISAWIVWEAVLRLRAPEPLGSGLMTVVALGGLLVNAVAAWILRPSQVSGLNARAAYLHVIGDLLGSVGTVVAALVIRATGWLIVDPIASLVMAALIVRGSWQLVRESVDILLESSPSHISLGAVRRQLESIPGVESVHDLHIWTVTSGMIAMSAHAIVREPERHQHVLEHALDAMRLFGIEHVTIQLERREMFERETHLHI
jgi:cobalt-zinc-cadmium efflux system protein